MQVIITFETTLILRIGTCYYIIQSNKRITNYEKADYILYNICAWKYIFYRGNRSQIGRKFQRAL